MMFRVQTNNQFSSILMAGIMFLSISFFPSCKGKQDSTPQVEESDELSDKTNADDSQQTKASDISYILFFGNSLTAGYGLDENQSFPALIQQRLDSLQLPYKAINAGLSGETTSGGKNRIDWVLKQKVDVFVLELGANDVLRGLDLKETEANLRDILDKVKTAYPDVIIVLAGMEAPPNMGNDYTRRFASIYPKLAKDYNAKLIPFLLKDVGGIPALNLPDGKHPNEEGQYIVRENVWQVLEKVI